MTRHSPTRLLAVSALAGFLSIWLGGTAAPQSALDGADADAGQWTMPAKDFASTRYSALAQINAGNAAGLRPVWTFSTGVLAGHEGQPLVVNNTMYVVTPFPNDLYTKANPATPTTAFP